MKSRRYVSGRALCPFYKCQEAQKIMCYGPIEGSVLHYCFDSPAKRKDFERHFCECAFKGCKGYQMHCQSIGEES